MSDYIPRRSQLLLNTPAEIAIRAAVDAVEDMGPAILLTEAVVLLSQAREKVADYIDAQVEKQTDTIFNKKP